MDSTTQMTPTTLETVAGQVEGIFVTTAAGQPMATLETARAIAGLGLEGDRYALGTGFYSDGQDGRQLPTGRDGDRPPPGRWLTPVHDPA